MALELECLPGPMRTCALVFERTGGGLGWSFADGANPSPIDVNGAQSPFALAHDGSRFHFFWVDRTLGRLGVASAAPGATALRPEGGIPLGAKVPVAMTAAAGSPPWVAFAERSGQLHATRVTFDGGGFQRVGEGRQPDLTPLGDGFAVLGFTAFDVQSSTMLPHAMLLRDLSVDAGVADAGSMGGVVVEDPKVTEGFKLVSAGCACDSAGSAFWFFLLLPLLAKRGQGRGEGR